MKLLAKFSAIALIPCLSAQAGPKAMTLEPAYSVRISSNSSFAGLELAAVSDDLPLSLFISEDKQSKLIRMNAGTGEQSDSLGKAGSELGMLGKPAAVGAFGPVVAVLEASNHRVQLFDGARMQALTQFGAEQLKAPIDMIVRSKTGSLPLVEVIDEENGKLHLHRFEITTTPSRADNRSNDYTVSAHSKIELGPRLGALSLARDGSKGLLIVLGASSGYQIDDAGTVKPFELPAELKKEKVSGLGLLACPGTTDKGYWVSAIEAKGGAVLKLFDRKNWQFAAAIKAPGTSRITHIKATTEPLAFFNFGGIFAIDNSKSVVSFDWDKIALDRGLMRICF
jgi:hypothetical protein